MTGSNAELTEDAGHFDVRTDTDEAGVVVRLSGELDIASAPVFEAALDELPATEGRVLLALGELTFIDSSGVAALIRCSARLAEQGRELVVTPPTRQVSRVLELVGLLERLVVVDPPPRAPEPE